MKHVFTSSLLIAAVGFMGCGEGPLGVQNGGVGDFAAPSFSHVPVLAPCNEAATVGGGALGISNRITGPVGPPNSLGWDVGSGQCNGSFTVTSDAGFPGGALELGLRAEQRSQGQVERISPNDYKVDTGPDPTTSARAWWNFQGSIAYNGNIADLDALTLTIITKAGPNLPSLPFFDMLAARPIIDDRNNQPNATATFSDLYQFSQNPEFGWFAPTEDNDANPTGAFDYNEFGAWIFTLTAIESGEATSVSICIYMLDEEDQCVGAKARKADVRSALEALLPTGDKKTDKRIEKAIKELTQSLNDDYWVDELHLTKKGKKVFSDQRKAAHELEKVVKDGGAFAGDAQSAIDELVKADAELAEIAIAEAIAGGGDAKEIEKAQKELAKALEELAEGDFDKAIEKYGKAWYHAMKALKKVL